MFPQTRIPMWLVSQKSRSLLQRANVPFSATDYSQSAITSRQSLLRTKWTILACTVQPSQLIGSQTGFFKGIIQLPNPTLT